MPGPLVHAEVLNLRALLEAERIPVDLTVDADTVVIHLHAPIDAATEAHLLNVVSHRVPRFRLDPVEGPALPPRAPNHRWVSAFLAKRPEYTELLVDNGRTDKKGNS